MPNTHHSLTSDTQLQKASQAKRGWSQFQIPVNDRDKMSLTSHLLIVSGTVFIDREVVENEVSLSLGKQFGGLGVGRQDDCKDDADEDRDHTLNEEQPTPAVCMSACASYDKRVHCEPLNALATIQLQDTNSDQPTDCITNLRTGIEDGSADSKLGSRVEGGHIVDSTGDWQEEVRMLRPDRTFTVRDSQNAHSVIPMRILMASKLP